MTETGKKLNELRVCDLKAELEQRKLDTIGPKAALVERLGKALKNEGLDPAEHLFMLNAKLMRNKSQESPSPAKKTSAMQALKIKEEPIEEVEEHANAKNSEQADGDEEEHGGEEDVDGDEQVDVVGQVDDECVIIDDDDEEAEDEYEGVEHQNGSGKIGNDDEQMEGGAADTTNVDNDESINLTIGEDEQKLLHDEAPDDKEKATDTKPAEKEKSTAAVAAATIEPSKENKGTMSAAKDEKKTMGKDDTDSAVSAAAKAKKKDEKTDNAKDTSEQKTTMKTTQKDDKEKATSNTAIAATAGPTAAPGNINAATVNASSKSSAGSGSASASGAKVAPSRNLWVSGLSAITRASDLKTIFSKYGKVIGAKVVTNTRTPGTRCYGYVTMSSSADAARCIDHLHRTELHGRIISVERTKSEIGGSSASSAGGAKDAARHVGASSAKKQDDDKKANTNKDSGSGGKDAVKSSNDKRKGGGNESNNGRKDDKDKVKRDNKDNDKKSSGDKDRERDGKARSETSSRHAQVNTRRSSRSPDRNRHRDLDRERIERQRERERERERIRQREILSYQKIREERERQRLREKERELREEERRRREIRERQRLEEQRLAEERKKLALERERLEREKAELLRLERERQKLEREKIELERLELKRQQMKIIQARDDPVKRITKRPADDRYAEVPERKRSSGTDSRFEAPPPPRFDASLVTPRSYEKKRDDYGSSTAVKRGVDEYTSSSKRLDYGKRDDYSSTSGSKRAAIDDYVPPAPTKRSTDDYSKRSTSDYIPAVASTKRTTDDYKKRTDYSSKSTRDDYKREVEIRHIPSTITGTGGNSSYHKSGGGNRYSESDRATSGSFRRGGIDDIRSTTGGKRYDSSGGYGSNSGGGTNGVWVSGSSHLNHSSSHASGGGGATPMKSYISNPMTSSMHTNSNWTKTVPNAESSWRPVQSSADRYDRTYNERSSGYPSGAGGGGMYGGSGRAPDRYGSQMASRY